MQSHKIETNNYSLSKQAIEQIHRSAKAYKTHIKDKAACKIGNSGYILSDAEIEAILDNHKMEIEA